MEERKGIMAALTNTLLIFIPTILAAGKSFQIAGEMGDHFPDGTRQTARISFAASAGCTVFFFGFYFCLTIGVPVDLDFIFPGIKAFPWWITPAALATSVYLYDLLHQNTSREERNRRLALKSRWTSWPRQLNVRWSDTSWTASVFPRIRG